ncbi:Lrp/AsnC family transcriptional regulator [Rhodococcus sp. NPDC047139]|uniref:Lrp/AsnC family transcriptional regulator n=1 Tax=Rhodococcus sp. NPDC047139 TaxID=3155141 RepID=UPI00340604B5
MNVRLIDEIDLKIINALQWSPRSTWDALSGPLGLDAATVARHWRRLERDRLAWTTITPGPRILDQVTTALLEITVMSGARDAVTATLSERPHAVTVEVPSAGADLLVTAATATYDGMTRLVVDELAHLPGVVSIRTHVVSEWFTEGGAWRLDALGPGERGELTATASARRAVERRTRTAVTATDRAILSALAVDGRTPMRTLAEIAGAGAATVKRRVEALLAADVIGLRCEFAHPAAGFAVLVTLWCAVPVEQLTATGRVVSREPEVRNCFAVVGAANLVVQAWLHSPAEAPEFEARLLARCADLTVRDRALVLRIHKLAGHVLDRAGRKVTTVPPDIWLPGGSAEVGSGA